MNQLHNEPGTLPVEVADIGDPARDAMDLLFELAVVLGDAMAQGLAARGLTTARAELIWRLHEQGSMTQRQLSQVLRCTPRNVTGLVDALESAELVNRGPHPTDRRATLVRLTKKGTDLATAWQAERQQGTATLLGDIPKNQLMQFVETLDRVLSRMRTGDWSDPSPAS